MLFLLIDFHSFSPSTKWTSVVPGAVLQHGATEEQCVLLNMADNSSTKQEVSQHHRGQRAGREEICNQVMDLSFSKMRGGAQGKVGPGPWLILSWGTHSAVPCFIRELPESVLKGTTPHPDPEALRKFSHVPD